MNKINTKNGSLVCAALLLLAGAVPASGSDSDTTVALSLEEAQGYLQWLHSLEKTISAREVAGQPEANLLYPFDKPGWETDQARPYRHLAISKAVLALEKNRGSAARAEVGSALMALSHARNYANLSEYDSALAWFDAAELMDKDENFRREIRRERLGTAVAAGDSATMAQLVTNTLGASDMTGRELELILACRWLLIKQDHKGLELIAKKVDEHPAVLSDRLRYWQAYVLGWLDRPQECLDHLRILVCSGGLSRDLSESQRMWVLTTIPDLLLHLGQTATSRSLYKNLADSSVSGLRLWGTYQMANLDLLAGKYEKAGLGYQTVCDAAATSAWQDAACEMIPLARELARIKSEGDRYGAAGFFSR